MHSHVDQISPILVEVKVEVPWPQVEQSLELAYRNLQRTAHVRGFRPGKVPRNVVKNLMGKSVERDVSTQLVEQGLGEAVKEHSLEPVSVSQMDNPAIAQGQPFSFKAQLEVKPKIDKVETSGLTVARKVEQVADADIERELARMREENAELVAPAEARGAREGDVLTLDIQVEVEGQPRPDLGSNDTRAELGGGRLLAEIEAALEGAALNEERRVSLTFPDDYGHEPLRGKPANFVLHLKQLQEKRLPDLDDELAKDLDHESLAALRTDVAARLADAARRRAETELREAVVEKLVDINPVPVPPSLIERQERAMIAELYQLQQLLGRPIPFDEKMHEEMHGRAERKIRAVLVLAALAEQQKISVSDDEVEAKLKEIAEQSGKHVAKVRAEYQGERREALHSQLLHNKLLEYLLTQATISEATSAEAEAPVSSEEKTEAASASDEGATKKQPKKKAEPTPKKAEPTPKKAAASGKKAESGAKKAEGGSGKSKGAKPKKAASASNDGEDEDQAD